MSDAAPYQIIDALADVLRAADPLGGHTIITDQSSDVAFEAESYPLVSIGLTAWRPFNDRQQGQTMHEIEVEFEVVSGKETAGLISRNNMASLAHVLAAIAADRTLDGLIEDIQESQITPAGPEGIEAGSTVLVTTVTFYTPRDDLFTIVS